MARTEGGTLHSDAHGSPGDSNEHDHSGVKPGPYVYRRPQPADLTNTEAGAGFDIVPHNLKEDLKGHVDKPDKVDLRKGAAPVIIVADDREQYAVPSFTANQVTVLPNQAVQLPAGHAMGRTRIFVTNASTNAGTVITVGPTSVLDGNTGYPLKQGASTPEMKHDREIWVYNADGVNNAVVSWYAEFSQRYEAK